MCGNYFRHYLGPNVCRLVKLLNYVKPILSLQPEIKAKLKPS